MMYSRKEFLKRAEIAEEWVEHIFNEVIQWAAMNGFDRVRTLDDRLKRKRAFDEEKRLFNGEMFLAS